VEVSDALVQPTKSATATAGSGQAATTPDALTLAISCYSVAAAASSNVALPSGELVRHHRDVRRMTAFAHTAVSSIESD
jgi:hypothetical protein